ncbi:MAG TPA: preprotein translocase subunit YajC [Treponemataceae bacterium]|nr:preprotein translocase subunit YajC [Treponemataceae bacterium]HQL05187.1 preprotein translocase subunit YajC [Treponemataceae bacterium]
MTVLPLALIFVIFYFFMIRPQNKKQKETEKMIAALKKGDKVITIGGIHGTVSSTKEKTVIVKVDDNTKIEFLRSAISTVVTDKAEKNGKKDTVEAVTAEAEKAIEEEKK